MNQSPDSRIKSSFFTDAKKRRAKQRAKNAGAGAIWGGTVAAFLPSREIGKTSKGKIRIKPLGDFGKIDPVTRRPIDKTEAQMIKKREMYDGPFRKTRAKLAKKIPALEKNLFKTRTYIPRKTLRLGGTVQGLLAGAAIGAALKPKRKKSELPVSAPKKIEMARGGTVQGLLAGAAIGAALSPKRKIEMARGLVHSYLLEKEEEDFKPHMMYDPRTGKGYKANTYKDHLAMKKKGYGHTKPQIKKTESKKYLSEVFPVRMHEFARTREKNPLDSLNPSGAVAAAQTLAKAKKLNREVKKRVTAARRGGEFASDVLRSRDAKRVASQLGGKQTVGKNQWRVGQETGSSVRVYKASAPRGRRKKYWWEKKANRDKMASAGIVGAIGIGAAAEKSRVRAKKQLTKERPSVGGRSFTQTDVAVRAAKNTAKAPGRFIKRARIKGIRRQLQKEFPNVERVVDPKRGIRERISKSPPPKTSGGKPNKARLEEIDRKAQKYNISKSAAERSLKTQDNLYHAKATKFTGKGVTPVDYKGQVAGATALKKRLAERNPSFKKTPVGDPGKVSSIEDTAKKKAGALRSTLKDSGLTYRKKGSLYDRVAAQHLGGMIASTAKLRKLPNLAKRLGKL